MKEQGCRDLREICEDRYQARSLFLTSQMPVSKWHEQIGDPTVADGILDRMVNNVNRIEMRGDSMRKKRGCYTLNGERGCAHFPQPLSGWRISSSRCAPEAIPDPLFLDEAEH